MPRPRKWRRVCDLPQRTSYGPIGVDVGSNDIVYLTVDEYETIRLIDLEGLQQEECSVRMNVARTTVQRIYNDARMKLAQFLVNGSILKIEGGDYKLCDENEDTPGCGKCARRRFGQGRQMQP